MMEVGSRINTYFVVIGSIYVVNAVDGDDIGGLTPLPTLLLSTSKYTTLIYTYSTPCFHWATDGYSTTT